jgi:hypothetical protein
MLYCQRSTPSKTQEAEKMGKKTVPIADQNTPKRKVFKTTESAIDVWPVIDNFKTILRRNGLKRLSGRSTYIGGRPFNRWLKSLVEARIG